jgi:hypothetical protein
MITEKEKINKFLIKSMNLMSSVAISHITSILMSAVSKGFTGKTTEMANYSEKHRTSISHFLRNGKWDSGKLQKRISEQSYDYILEKSKKNNSPIFFSFDDTVNAKKKPSSKSSQPMEGTAFHYSHLLGKTVWGHEALAALLSTENTALVYHLERCGERKGGKIEAVKEIANSLPEARKASYALMDSWYTCPEIINTFSAKGFHTIAALKTNRIIYPQEIRISIQDFTKQYIQESDANLVTVGSKKYWVYRYEGRLNEIENAIVLITYPENAFGLDHALRSFICTDVSLETSVILEFYRNRWKIEVFFKQQKNLLGFSGYQMRSKQAIDRFWIILSLTVFYCVTGTGSNIALGKGVLAVRFSISTDFARSFYDAGRAGVPFESVSVFY